VSTAKIAVLKRLPTNTKKMKIHLTPETIKLVLSGLSKAVQRRATLPVLSYVLIQRKKSLVALTVTDLDAWITLAAGEDIAPDASALVPLVAFKAIPKNSAATVNIGDKSTSLTYMVGETEITVPVDFMPADDFPATPTFAGPVPCPLGDAKSHILQAMQCASKDAMRYVLQGCYLDVSKANSHVVVATDGTQLFSANSVTLPFDKSVILPDHAFVTCPAFVKDGPWSMSTDKDECIVLASDNFTFQCSAIDANFPNWRQVIPDSGAAKTRITFTPDTAAAILRMLPGIPESKKDINHGIGLRVTKQGVELLGRTSESGFDSTFPVTAAVKGLEQTIALNRELLKRALSFGLLDLEVFDPLSALRFHAPSRQMVVMPMRVA